MGHVTSSWRHFTKNVSCFVSTPYFFHKSDLWNDQMSNMLGNGSLTHGDAMDVEESSNFQFSKEPSLEKIRQMQSEFAKERDWDQFHQPRNLLLAMVGEVGEVAELFQWKDEVREGLPDWSAKEKHHLAQELSDVLVYLVRLAEKCHVDLPKEVVAKIALNSKKYPAHLVKGSSKKYTEYKEMNSSNH